MNYKDLLITKKEKYSKIKKNNKKWKYKSNLTNNKNFYNEINFLPNICKEDKNYFYIERLDGYRNITFSDLISDTNILEYLFFKKYSKKIILSDIGKIIFNDIKNLKKQKIVKTCIENNIQKLIEIKNELNISGYETKEEILKSVSILPDLEFEYIFIKEKNKKLLDWKFYNKDDNLFYFAVNNIIITDGSIIGDKPVGEEAFKFENKGNYIINKNKIYKI